MTNEWVDSLPLAAWIVDEETNRIVTRNGAAAAIALAPEDLDRSFYRVVRDGFDMTYQLHASRVELEGRQFRLVVGIDVTGLKATSEKLGQLVDGSADIIYDTDARGHFTFTNAAARRILGLSPTQIVGQHFTALIREDWRARALAFYRAQISTRTETTYYEFPCIAADGREVWIGQHVRLNLRGDAVAGFQAVARDITELRAAQQARLEIEHRFHAFMNNSPAVSYIRDEHGAFVWVNEPMANLCGRKAEELMSGADANIVVKSVEPAFGASDEAIRAAGKPVRSLETIVTPEGDTRHLLIYKFPVPGPGGASHIGAVGVDVSDRVTLELALADARDEALASARQKSEFLANMSHEIRTPMNGVLGMLGLLLDTKLTQDQRDLAETARSSADALLTVINDILDFSKSESGMLRFEQEDFDVRSNVESVIDLVAQQARDKSLEVGSLFEANVPQQVRGDGGRLRQILVNLVGNAIKFTSSGAVLVRVSAVESADGTHLLRFDVRDTGIGISEEERARLFQPFSQADASTTRRFGGTGLGLAISRSLVRQMGGEIGVESEIGKGSNFWFTARFEASGAERPQDADRAANKHATSITTATPTEVSVERKERLLVVEDNPVNQKVTVRQLQKLGYAADAAANGIEALDAVARTDYVLIFMDCHMPEMDGFEATTELRARGTTSPIIALTASALPADRTRCFEAGMDDFLTKPIREKDLSEVLSRWVTKGN